jgi:CheY-like chemotaxis protein
MLDQSILVIEPDPGVSALLTDLLSDAGYVVLGAARGQQGLHIVAQDAPSLVVVNHVLPDMSGLDVLEHLRGSEATRRIPVVLVSGRPQPIDGGCSADRVLSMPFDITVLLEYVEQLTPASRISVA